MRKTFAKTISNFADRGLDFMVLTADLGYSVLDNFKDCYPQKFFNIGISENSMVGIAAGLSLGGKRTFVYSISSFLATKCFEQIRDDICYHNLPVILVGSGSGFSYGYAGYTHFSIEDIACLRTIPNLTIVSPTDPHELELLLEDCMNYDGPVYLRIGRDGEKIYSQRLSLKIGESYYINEEDHVALVTHGNIIGEVIGAREKLKDDGLSVSVVSCPTIYPLDQKFFDELSKKHRFVFVVEEHGEIGGLGDVLQDYEIIKIAIPEKIIYVGGNQDYLRRISGINAESIYKKVKTLVSQ